ncbi:MAG: penicillin-binding protein 1B [Psychromonas sp.]
MPKNNKTAATDRKQKKNSRKKNAFKRSILNALWSFLLKGTFAFIALMFIAGIYLDKKIERRLDGSTWTLPAQVYARPLVLKNNSNLSKQALISELKLLNYRPVEYVQASGQFSVNNQQVLIYKRAFNFPDRYEGAGKIAVNFSAERITSIVSSEQGNIGSVRLDPLLLDRLLSDNAEDRVFIAFDQIPDLFIDTLILMEDRNFYDHKGISPIAIIRAFIVNLKAGQTVQGGSTLTQQLAKNLFLSQERSLWRKFQEAYIAVLIDYKYSKDKILEAYVNEVYLAQNGNSGIYGIELASDYFFSRPINELRLDQMALLVAIIKGPSFYNPYRNPQRAQDRRDLVLRKMLESGLINSLDYQYAIKGELNLSARGALNHRANPAFVSLLHRELQTNVAQNVRKSNGLLIFTSIDPFVQRNAELAVAEGVNRLQKKGQSDLQGAMVVSDRKFAEVLALVAGKDVKFSGFNRALDAKRPIGSLVKPIVYLTALDAGFDLSDRLADKKIVLKNGSGQRWSPKNYDRKFRGEVSLEEALIHSLNVPTVNLGMQVGLKNVINNLYQMGVKEKIIAYPSLVLGSVALSPFQVAQMYQPIAMSGVYQPLTMIRSIVSSDGKLLYQRSMHKDKIFSTEAVLKLTNTLHKVTTQGTARSLSWRNKGQYFSGKTGTTNRLNDSWFVGFDAEQVVTTWVGRDDNKSAELTGSSGALILFSDYMQHKKAY